MQSKFKKADYTKAEQFGGDMFTADPLTQLSAVEKSMRSRILGGGGGRNALRKYKTA